MRAYILDNGVGHITHRTRARVVAQAGRMWFRFATVQTSWLNQRAGLALSAFSRRCLRDRASDSREEFITRIYRLLEECNQFYACPFVWSFTRQIMHQWYCWQN